MKRRTSRKSFLAMLLALAMLLTMIPAAAFAAEEKAIGVETVTSLTAGEKYVIVTKVTEAGGDVYYAMSNVATDYHPYDNNPSIGLAEKVKPGFKDSKINKLTIDAAIENNIVFESTNASGGVYLEGPDKSTNHYQMYITQTAPTNKGGIKYQNESPRVAKYSNNQLYGTSGTGSSATTYYVTFGDPDANNIRFKTTQTQSEAAEIIMLRLTGETPEPEDPLAPEKQSAKDAIDSSVAKLIKDYGYYEAGLTKLNDLATEYKGKIDAADSPSIISDLVNEFSDKAGTILTKTAIDEQNAILDKISTTPEFATYTKEEQKKILDLIAKYKTEIEGATSSEEMKGLVKEFQTGLDNITAGSQATADAKTKASSEIDKAVADSNLAKYKAAEQAKIKELATKYKDAISKAASPTEVNKLLADFNAEVAKLKTAAQIDSETNAALKAQVTKATVSIKKPKVGKKKITAKWKANKLFDGYQVSYRIKGKKWKKVTVKGGTKTKKVIKKLKKGKKYQVKVRGYKTIAGAKVYSKFSKTKTTAKIK